MNNKVLYRSISVLLLLVVWEILSRSIGAEFLLASPITVIKRLFQLIFEAGFLKTVVFSFGRITFGFLLAFIFGILAAIAAGRFKPVEHFLWPYVATIKAVPIASFIILFLLWMDFGKLTVVITAMIVFPVIYSNVLQGIKNADSLLLEVAELYHVPYGRRFVYIYLPSVKPFLISAGTIGIGMAWKSGVAAEVIGIIRGSIGEKLYEAKIYFLNADLLAWTIVIVLVSVLTEKIFTWLLKTIFRRIERI